MYSCSAVGPRDYPALRERHRGAGGRVAQAAGPVSARRTIHARLQSPTPGAGCSRYSKGRWLHLPLQPAVAARVHVVCARCGAPCSHFSRRATDSPHALRTVLTTCVRTTYLRCSAPRTTSSPRSYSRATEVRGRTAVPPKPTMQRAPRSRSVAPRVRRWYAARRLDASSAEAIIPEAS